jgi:hypothetical protein
MHIYGFIKESESGAVALVLDAEKTSNKKLFSLIDNGWEQVIDNTFESIEYAYEVMEQGVTNAKLEEVCAYKEYCRCCGRHVSVSKVIGRRFDFIKEKKVLFNGRVCEECLNDFESYRYVQ